MTIQPFSKSQWTAIDALGHQVDQLLQTAGVGLRMGGEPTYVSARDRTDLQWRYQALGEEKRRLAEELLARLASRLAYSGSLRHYGIGKLYPGEAYPRWAFGCFWRPDGQPLWRNADLLAAADADTDFPWQAAETFMTELATCLAISPEAILPAYELDEQAPAGFVLPLLTTEAEGCIRWQSCRWTGFDRGVILLPGEAGVGLRLPLAQLTAADALLPEACPPFNSAPIRPEQRSPLAADDSIRLALVVSVEAGRVTVFLPPIATARSFADVITAIEATAEVLDQPVLLTGYGPPSNQGIEGFKITPDPGVLEVNIHPADTWPELVRLHTVLDEEAIACGLSCEKYGQDGRLLGTGGGSHITIGGSTPETSPLLRRPDLLRSLITYWQHHPSLSYVFAGQYIGPTSQSPRVDEARHDSLYELEVAFLSLAPGKAIAPEIIDRLLSPFLQDVSGNTHRTALCIDKLHPTYQPMSRLGLLEFRGFEMPADTGLRLLQMLLIRALVAWFWQQPFTPPLKRWGPELRDRWLLPHYLIQDFHRVLKELKAANLPFELDWFTPFLLQRFPQIGKVALSQEQAAPVLELRTALEPWPVIGDAGGSGTSRPVDNSMERLQLFLTGAAAEMAETGALAQRYALLCNGHRVPLRATGTAGNYVGAVRFRARPPIVATHPAIAPHLPLQFELIDIERSQFLGGLRYPAQVPDPASDLPLPQSPEEARDRRQKRCVPLTEGTVPPTLPPLVVHPETPLTLDLRLVAKRSGE